MELRVFGAFTVPEVAELLDVSISLVEKEYRGACAFLRASFRGPLKHQNCPPGKRAFLARRRDSQPPQNLRRHWAPGMPFFARGTPCARSSTVIEPRRENRDCPGPRRGL